MSISQEIQQRERPLRGIIEKHAKLFGLDPNLIRALITQESAFVAEAVSPTGAYSSGQFTGIGAKQAYQNISRMTEKAADLHDFTKRQASDPDKGIKAICATLWWLIHVKYKRVENKQVKLEAALTFYNSGGRPAALVVSHGGHANALSFIKNLPRNIQSQSATYAPRVASRYVQWHDLYKDKQPIAPSYDELEEGINPKYAALVESLKLLGMADRDVDVIVDQRDGLTEITLIFPGNS